MHAKVTSSSENHVKMNAKNPTPVQIQAAVKAEGLPDKENPGPMPLPGKSLVVRESNFFTSRANATPMA